MYNYYTYKKEQNEENKKESHLIKEHYRKINHKGIL